MVLSENGLQAYHEKVRCLPVQILCQCSPIEGGCFPLRALPTIDSPFCFAPGVDLEVVPVAVM